MKHNANPNCSLKNNCFFGEYIFSRLNNLKIFVFLRPKLFNYIESDDFDKLNNFSNDEEFC